MLVLPGQIYVKGTPTSVYSWIRAKMLTLIPKVPVSQLASPPDAGVDRRVAAQAAGLEDSTRPNTAATEYRVAFRSAGIMGGASALNMAFGLARAKVMAVLLGPGGTGLMGLYGQVTGLVATLSNLGISSSGVRQIAESAGTGDMERIARTDLTVRRMAWVTGSIGLILQLSFCWLLSQWTFGERIHWQAIATLAVVPLLQALSGAEVARIQGLRRIGDLARQSILGALAGTVTGVGLIWYFGFAGIVPQMIVVAFMTLVFSSYFSRKVPLPRITLPWRESAREARGLVGLGFSFMASGLAGAVAAYLISAMIARKLGVNANGLYLAAWSLSGLYANFVLNAMGADYFPRLTTVAHDRSRLLPMVNQQAEIALLIATPGIVGTLAFAPWAIHLFYSSAYLGAYEVMRWLILGVFLRLVSWPLAFILLAKGAATMYLVTEVLHQLVNVALTYALLGTFGLPGVGAAFTGLYVIYSAAILAVVVLRYGFRYSRTYLPLFTACLAMTMGAFFLQAIPAAWLRYSVGAALSSVACLICGLTLKRLMGLGDVKEVLDMAFALAGLKRRAAVP
jgi:enterobacterial common antigen flippase